MYSRLTGLVFIAGLVVNSAAAGTGVGLLGLWVGVVAGWAWLSAVSAHFSRTVNR